LIAGGRGGYDQAARSRGRGELRPQNSANSVSWSLPTGCLRVFSSVAPVAAGCLGLLVLREPLATRTSRRRPYY
jgi:hypothetical protein